MKDQTNPLVDKVASINSKFYDQLMFGEFNWWFYLLPKSYKTKKNRVMRIPHRQIDIWGPPIYH